MKWGLGAVGLAGTQVLDQHFVNPLAVRFGAPSVGLFGEVVDGLTTLGTALAGGAVASKLLRIPRRFVEPAVYGGGILGAAKLITAPIPGATVSPTLPIHLDNLLPHRKVKQIAVDPNAGRGTTALGNAGFVSDPSRPAADGLNGGL